MKLFIIFSRKSIVFTVLIAILGLFQGCGTVYNAQKSVSEANRSARRLIKKPDDKRILDFSAKYALARADMQRILNEAQYNPMVYGEIADNAIEWMNLSSLLKTLESIRIQGVQHVLVVEATDYTSIVADARQRASDAYYDEGVKIIQLSSDFQRRKGALSYFDKSMRYTPNHVDDIAYYKSQIYLEEADRLLLSGSPSLERLSLARGYYNEALRFSANDPAQQQIIWNKLESLNDTYVVMLIDRADHLARMGDPESVHQAIADYSLAIEMGSREAATKKQDLLMRVGIVVVISGERVSVRFLDDLQRQLPNYVQVKMHSPLLGSRYDGDILIIPHRDWGKRDREGNFELSFEIVDLRRAGLVPHKLADFPYKAKSKESFEKVLERNQIRIAELIRSLGLNRPNTNWRF